MMTQIRVADSDRDQAEARRQVQEAFGNDSTVRKIQRAVAQNEVKARDLLRRGDRMKKSGAFDNAVAKYNAILKDYPDTVTAKAAESRLQAMGRNRSVSPADELMMELMRQ
jgi:predicted TPR repeat methyltransferase